MGRLIKNELIKLFKKKSIYITLIVIFAFMIFSNFMYKSTENMYYSGYIYSEQSLNYLNEQIKGLDPEKASDTSAYIDIKSQIDMFEMMREYEDYSWQQQIIGEKMSNYFREKNTYQYGIEKDEQKANEIQAEIDNLKQKLDTDDWKYFAEEELNEVNERIAEIENQERNTEDKQVLKNLAQEKETAKVDKMLVEYRLDKDIKYGNDYLNEAIMSYESSANEIIRYDAEDRDLTYEEQRQYNMLLEDREINKYILDNKVDIYAMNLKNMLQDFFSQFGILIVVMVVMVAVTIVSEEFNKGTIKLLLVKPYSRSKILAAKFITTMIMIAFVVVVMVVMELLIGGIMFGFDSLSIPVLQYNFNTNSIQ